MIKPTPSSIVFFKKKISDLQKKKILMIEPEKIFYFPELTFCVPETPKRLFWQTL